MRAFNSVLLTAVAVFMISPAMAQSEPVKSMDHTMHKTMMENHYGAAMEKMHKDMMVAPTGDADVDFVKGMIPHHQGAIDMAKVVLEKGKDPEIKKLAEGIVKAQESEIKMMNEWLKAHGH